MTDSTLESKTENSQADDLSLSSLRYDYKVENYDETTHYGRLLSRVGSGKRVLELGSSTGFLSEPMVRQFNCQVTGIEIDEDAAAAARAKGLEVLVLDLDSADLAQALAGRQFDVVLCADVLEHLRDPGRTLRQLVPLLAEDGYLVCSIPHIGHADIKLSLLAGRLPYRPVGLLDHTHMKFFTRALLEQVFESAGLELLEVERNRWGTTFTEVQGRLPAQLEGLSDYLAADPESETYQFIVKAAPYRTSGQRATSLPTPSARVDVVVIDRDAARADDVYQKSLADMRYPAHLLRYWFISESGSLALADKPNPEGLAYERHDFRSFRFAGLEADGADPQNAQPGYVGPPSGSTKIKHPGVNIASQLAQVARGSDAEYLFVLLADTIPGANCLAQLVNSATHPSFDIEPPGQYNEGEGEKIQAARQAVLVGARPEIRPFAEPFPASGCARPRELAAGAKPIAWRGFSALLIPRTFLLELKSIDPNLWTVEAQAADMCFRAWATGLRVLECEKANYFSNGPTALPGDYDDTVSDGLRLRRRWGTARNIIAYGKYCAAHYGAGRLLTTLKTINHVVAAFMIETPLSRALSEEARPLVGFTGPGASVMGLAPQSDTIGSDE